MTEHLFQLLHNKGIRVATIAGMTAMLIGPPGAMTSVYSAEASKAGDTTNLREDAETLLKGNRTLLGYHTRGHLGPDQGRHR
jgi:hypothetical protein